MAVVGCLRSIPILIRHRVLTKKEIQNMKAFLINHIENEMSLDQIQKIY